MNNDNYKVLMMVYGSTVCVPIGLCLTVGSEWAGYWLVFMGTIIYFSNTRG